MLVLIFYNLIYKISKNLNKELLNLHKCSSTKKQFVIFVLIAV
jgi:hypothetical protein